VSKDAGRCVTCGSEADVFALPLAAADAADAGRLRDMFRDAGAQSIPHLKPAEGAAAADPQVYVVACRRHLRVLAELHHRIHRRDRLTPEDVRATLGQS